jgi:hypothetical protein
MEHLRQPPDARVPAFKAQAVDHLKIILQRGGHLPLPLVCQLIPADCPKARIYGLVHETNPLRF